jgi:hypothetical protein
MTRELFVWLSAVMSVALPASAQQARHKLGDSDNVTSGELYITRLPNAPRSLEQLCAQSSLILEGAVNEVLPARDMGRHLLETDSTVDVITTLKGSPTAQVAISQAGGTKDGVTSKPVAFAVVQPGEHYILFLRPDTRSTVPAIEGMQRYTVTGIWSGLFYFNKDNVMSLNSGHADPARANYLGMTLPQIMAQVKTILASQQQ